MPSTLSFPSPGIPTGASTRHVLIYIISGNPGLIDYYLPFSSTLRNLLNDTEKRVEDHSVSFHIYGRDLAGFGPDDHQPFTKDNPPHDVAYQIQYAFDKLSSLRIEADGPRKGTPYDDVIIIAHSVGSYITLEIFDRQLKNASLAPHLNLTAGILLFPTIAHMRHSPAGKKFNLLRTVSFLDRHAHHVAQSCASAAPAGLANWLLRNVLGQAPHGADVTTRFLKSRDGVWQALHLGKDEMRVIDEDRFDDELWEIVKEAEEDGGRQQQQPGTSDVVVPKFFFFFGKDDHWVASHLRDEFIAKRSRQKERTRFQVDEGNLPHAFCLNHSETVAEKVKVWIDEIVSAKRE